MLKKVLSLFFLLITISGYTIEMHIRVFSRDLVTAAQLEVASGRYRIKGDFDHLGVYSPGAQITLRANNNQVAVFIGDSAAGTYHAIAFRGEGFVNNFRINPVEKEVLPRNYDDDLDIRAQDGQLVVINRVELEKYVAGVVQSEGGGSSKNLEYFQVQAVSCRTYALNNHRRHHEEGYHLCDDVHCQVYKGRAVNSNILMAARRTAGEVIVDTNNRMIAAAFHSNCGGETHNSEDVWSIPTPYLKERMDSFCINMPNAQWKYSIGRKQWFDYLKDNHGYDLQQPGALDPVLAFKQNHRKKYLVNNIRLRTIREDLDLRSTYFSITEKQDSVIFNGKGFGHGVGLCQEGAIHMAENGYTYHQIIHHYYYNVKVVNFMELKSVVDELDL